MSPRAQIALKAQRQSYIPGMNMRFTQKCNTHGNNQTMGTYSRHMGTIELRAHRASTWKRNTKSTHRASAWTQANNGKIQRRGTCVFAKYSLHVSGRSETESGRATAYPVAWARCTITSVKYNLGLLSRRPPHLPGRPPTLGVFFYTRSMVVNVPEPPPLEIFHVKSPRLIRSLAKRCVN